MQVLTVSWKCRKKLFANATVADEGLLCGCSPSFYSFQLKKAKQQQQTSEQHLQENR